MTKKYTILCLCSLAALFADGQFEKGQKVIGGYLGLMASKADNANNNNNYPYYSRTANVNLGISLGKFTKPDRLCGINLYYGNAYGKTSGFGDVTTNQNLGIAVFSQKFLTLAKNLFFTVTGTAGISGIAGRQTLTSTNEVTKNQGFGVNAGLAPGASYRLSPKWLFDMSLNNFLNAGFTHSQYRYTGPAGAGVKNNSDSFYLFSSLNGSFPGSLAFGFRYLLKK